LIKKIRGRLSVKVFLITLLLMMSCCGVTYLCIARFAPYIYSHELSEGEEIADMLSDELSHVYFDEAKYFILPYCDFLSENCDNEFVFHIFKNSGEEIALPLLDTLTGRRMTDYKNITPVKEYQISFADSTEEYILLLTGNTSKKSQIIEALQKSLPILSITVFMVSLIAAFFYIPGI